NDQVDRTRLFDDEMCRVADRAAPFDLDRTAHHPMELQLQFRQALLDIVPLRQEQLAVEDHPVRRNDRWSHVRSADADQTRTELAGEVDRELHDGARGGIDVDVYENGSIRHGGASFRTCRGALKDARAAAAALMSIKLISLHSGPRPSRK